MPGFDAKLPLQLSPIDGAYGVNSDLREVFKQDLKMLILTNPGERVMDAGYGVGVRRMLFENKTADLRAHIFTRLTQQLAKYMPHLQINEFTYLTSEEDDTIDEHAVRIYVSFFIPSLNVGDAIEFETFTGVR